MRYILIILCEIFERLCRLTHPFVRWEVKLTGRHCNLASLSYRINKENNLNVWKKPTSSAVSGQKIKI